MTACKQILVRVSYIRYCVIHHVNTWSNVDCYVIVDGTPDKRMEYGCLKSLHIDRLLSSQIRPLKPRPSSQGRNMFTNYCVHIEETSSKHGSRHLFKVKNTNHADIYKWRECVDKQHEEECPWMCSHGWSLCTNHGGMCSHGGNMITNQECVHMEECVH